MARTDPPGCLAIVGCLLFVVGLFGMIRACLALFHHQTVYWTLTRLLIPTWLNPWQGIVGYGLVVAFAVYGFVIALRSRKK
jgi:hypothetical protein